MQYPTPPSDLQGSLWFMACGALEVIGQFDGRLSHGRKSTTQNIFVVKGPRNNLLCLPAIVALNLVVRYLHY